MGTFGHWYTRDNDSWAKLGPTVEQPWRVNEQYAAGIPYKSCIPAGTYELAPFKSTRWGSTWAFVNAELGVVARQVAGTPDWFRFACLLHTANWAVNVEGCVGVGSNLSAAMPPQRGEHGVQWMVTDSAATIKKLKATLAKSERHTVNIRDVGYTHTFK